MERKIGRKIEYKGELFSGNTQKIFMDRDDARKIFWEVYDALSEGIAEGDALSFVINYYGFGGIGKSELCNYLNDILLSNLHPNTQEELNSKSFVFSFEEIKNNCDIVEVLSCLANKFEKECGYDLIYFKYALYAYYRKKGLAVDSPEINSLGKNSAFNMVLDALEFVPVVGEIGSAIIKNAEVLISDVKALMLEHKKEIIALDMDSENAIKEKLSSFFVTDIYRFLVKEKGPVVVFLDTYEHLQNYIHKNSSKMSEEFLWADTQTKGLIRKMPNVLWIIAGQQKLTWAEDSYRKYKDEYWMGEDTIAYEMLTEIDKDNITAWFTKLKIDEPELVYFIYQKTKGVPIHVSACIDRYFSIKNKERQPSKSDFDMDYKELAARFIGGLSDNARDLIEILACLEKWTYKDIEELNKTYGISYSLYEYLRQFSFVRVDGDMHYMHESVREMVRRDSLILNKETVIKYLKKKAGDGTLTSAERKDCIFRKIELQLLIIESETDKSKKCRLVEAFFEENIDFIRENIYDDYYFKTVLERMRESITEDCIPYLYEYILIAYQSYRFGYEGNYKLSENYINLIDLANFNYDMYMKGKYFVEAQALLCCAVALCRGTKTAYLEAIDSTKNIKDNYAKILMLVGYAHVLERSECYEETLEYCENAMEILAGMQADTLRAGFECEIILVQAKAKFELFKEDEALLLLASAETLIEKYKDAQDENALVWFAQIYSLIADLSYEESKRLEYAKKSLEISNKVYQLNSSVSNTNNVADSYKTVADLLPQGDEKVINYYDAAIAIFKKLYEEAKKERYLKKWIFSLLEAFEKTQDESYLLDCKKVIKAEYKPLILSYLELKILDEAKQLLEDYEEIINKAYGFEKYEDRENESLEEVVWRNSKLAGVEYFLGNRKSAYFYLGLETQSRKRLARHGKIENIRAYVDSCARWVLLRKTYGECDAGFHMSRLVSRKLCEGTDLLIEQAETIKEGCYVEEFYELAENYLDLLIELYEIFDFCGDIDKAQSMYEQSEKLRKVLGDLKQNYFFN